MKGIESEWQIPCRRCGALVDFGGAQNALLDEAGYAHALCPVCREENTLFTSSPQDLKELKRARVAQQAWIPILLLLLILALVLLLLPLFHPTPKRKGYDPGLFASAPSPSGLSAQEGRNEIYNPS